MGASAVRLGDARTVTVTARLRHGVVLPRVFPAPLDGIIAARVRRTRLGDDYWAEIEAPPRAQLDADPHGSRDPAVKQYRDRQRGHRLPVAQLNARRGNRWVWAATCAIVDPDPASDLRHIHKRFDGREAEQVVDRLPANTDVGATKANRLPYLVTVTDRVVWRALGDPDGIGAVLAEVDQIGKRKASGEGVVTGWEIVDDGPADRDAVCWLPDGRIARPFPVRHADLLGLVDPDTTLVDAYRPPYWRAAATTDGSFRREPREVIAPWTTKP